jgi:hypothetical protein
MDIPINYLAVLVAGISQMILGSLWYGPLFGKKWSHLMGWSQSDMESMKNRGGMGKLYFWQFVASLVTAYVLAHFVSYFDATDVSRALQLAFWSWLGFIATISLTSILWENKSKELYGINVAYHLIGLCIMSVILALWR